MRIPRRPPSQEELFKPIAEPGRFARILEVVKSPTVSGKYLHWDELRHRTPPEGLSLTEWWFGLKLRRSPSKLVPLLDPKGASFAFVMIDAILKSLHTIDLSLGGTVPLPEPVTNPETKQHYLVRSLIEEAITSSQLEGAATTREVAKEMIREGRKPRDRSERMIFNNYQTMRRIAETPNAPLSKERIFELHRIVTEGTLDDPTAAGRLRRDDEYRVVGDDFGEVYHRPPPADQLEGRMAAMCDFANESPAEEGFIHPAIRSILLHFWLAYDHPFVDGNGRTARALFYWSMLHHGYWLFEFVSISRIILKGPARYGEAFLQTETDGNDLTYFLVYNFKIISQAVAELNQYIEDRGKELRALDRELRGMTDLNHRQRELIRHALRHPGESYTVESHRLCHGVVKQTARTDLEELERRGLVTRRKIGQAWTFTPVADLEERLRVGD